MARPDEPMTLSLATKLGVGPRELVSFVGAGGKTSLLLGLGAELAAGGERIVLTTTTKMGADQIPDWATVCRTDSDVVDALDRGETAFLVGSVADEKVTGVRPEFVDRVFVDSGATHVLVEADGARGRSLKAPAPHEPVIPDDSTLVVVVAGMDAIGRPIRDVAHRPERVAALLDGALDDPVRPADLALVLGHEQGGLRGVPAGSRVTVALTKASPGSAADSASQVSELLNGTAVDRVAIIDFHPTSDRPGFDR